ncbi:uncharacterized protein LOC134418572 isoform X1 [Melospiza melodia melodia]|uniref:uncharacterized protein LOC134418572 isoform X1 n=1 Tax=Melospiza melodia melodia TaxID=1914991 RepID=UPI002FD4BC40
MWHRTGIYNPPSSDVPGGTGQSCLELSWFQPLSSRMENIQLVSKAGEGSGQMCSQPVLGQPLCPGGDISPCRSSAPFRASAVASTDSFPSGKGCTSLSSAHLQWDLPVKAFHHLCTCSWILKNSKLHPTDFQVMPAAPWAPPGLLVLCVGWGISTCLLRAAPGPGATVQAQLLLQIPQTRGAAAFRSFWLLLPCAPSQLGHPEGTPRSTAGSEQETPRPLGPETAPAPAATVTLSWQRSPAGNAPCHSPEEPQELSGSLLPGETKGHCVSTFTAAG